MDSLKIVSGDNKTNVWIDGIEQQDLTFICFSHNVGEIPQITLRYLVK